MTTMTRLSCRNGYSYSSSDITDRMICARDANKDSCQVATNFHNILRRLLVESTYEHFHLSHLRIYQ